MPDENMNPEAMQIDENVNPSPVECFNNNIYYIYNNSTADMKKYLENKMLIIH